jgi:hypothetical protein
MIRSTIATSTGSQIVKLSLLQGRPNWKLEVIVDLMVQAARKRKEALRGLELLV